MTRIEVAPGVIDDLDRFVGHMRSFGLDDVEERIEDLIAAIDVLARSPQIGRPAKGDRRELVVGKGARGNVVLYRYVELVDTVFILAVRGQREAGYKRGAR